MNKQDSDTTSVEQEGVAEENQENLDDFELEQEDSESDVVDDLKKQIEELQDKLLRQLAESENIRTRATKQVEEVKNYAVFDFSRDLISVMDNLSRALDHLPENLSNDVKNIVAGIEMTKSELESVFKKHKLESIAPHSGDKFDYHLHHAISQVVTEECKSGSIVTTMQNGYKIKDRLIRPASVTVAKNS